MVTTISNWYLFSYFFYKFDYYLSIILFSIINNPEVINLILSIYPLHIEIFYQVKDSTKHVSLTWKDFLRRVLTPTPVPPKDKDSWIKKLKKFWQDNKEVIVLVAVLAGVGIFVYYYYKNSELGEKDNDNDSDDDSQGYNAPLPEDIRLGRLWMLRKDQLQAKKDELKPVVEELYKHYGETGWEDYTAYINLIAKICEFSPSKSYLFYHLRTVVGDGENTAHSANFKRLAHCLSDTYYAAQTAQSKLIAKDYQKDLYPERLNDYKDMLTTELANANFPLKEGFKDSDDYEEWLNVIISYLDQLKTGSGNNVSHNSHVSGELDKLAKVLQKSEILCKFFS